MEMPEKKSSITITSGTIIRILVILVLAFVAYKMLDLVLVVLTAIVIASAIEPIIKWFSKFKIKRLLAVLITYIVTILTLSSLLYFFIPPVLDEASSLLNDAPKYLESITLWNPLNVADKVVATKISSGVVAPAANLENTPTVLGDLINQFRELTTNASTHLVSIISNIFGGVFSFVLIIVLSFYLAVQEGGVEKFLKIVTPMKNEAYVIDLWKRSQKKIGYWMQGQLLLMLLVGVLVYLGLMILGVKNALLLAVLAAVMEIIPLFGPVVASIPAILFGMQDGGTTVGILVLGLFVIIHQFENHLIYPLVVKKVVGVSPIIVILSLIVFAKLFGFLGIVLSVPITSVLMEFLDDMQKEKHA
jgi:predicted PurR-regulated permease PerM